MPYIVVVFSFLDFVILQIPPPIIDLVYPCWNKTGHAWVILAYINYLFLKSVVHYIIWRFKSQFHVMRLLPYHENHFLFNRKFQNKREPKYSFFLFSVILLQNFIEQRMLWNFLIRRIIVFKILKFTISFYIYVLEIKLYYMYCCAIFQAELEFVSKISFG